MAYTPKRLLRDTLIVAIFAVIIVYQACLVLFKMLFGLFNPGSVDFEADRDIPNLEGKVVVITGGMSNSLHLRYLVPEAILIAYNGTGNIGLGRETILQLSKHNPSQIYLLARNQSKAESAISELLSLVPDARISFLQCDLASFSSIRDCAQEFVRREKRLDILILNAGVMALPPGVTEEGYELQFGTNHMGHALLTKLLMPTMLQTTSITKSARIVVLSSIAHWGCFRGIAYHTLKTDMGKTWTLFRYCQSKLANVLFARALANRYGEQGVTAVSVHPGLVETPIYDTYFEEFGFVGKIAHQVKRLLWVSVEDGAKGTLWAVSSGFGEVEDKKRQGKPIKNGNYHAPVGAERQGSRLAYNDGMADELWEWTQKELEGWELDSR